MDTFLRQLETLDNASEGAYARTLATIKSDCQHATGNPHGNISESTQTSIEGMCSGKGGGETGHLKEVVVKHYAFQYDAGCVPHQPAPDLMLRTVVLKDIFVAYHLNDGRNKKVVLEDIKFVEPLASIGKTTIVGGFLWPYSA